MTEITVDRLKQVKRIFAHAHCPDGLGAAMICKAAFAAHGLFPEIDFIQYDTADHENIIPGPHQLFVDITPPLKRWKEWEPFDPIVLDHHETAKPAADGLGGVYGGLDDSGASLAFKHVMRMMWPSSSWGSPTVANGREVLEKWARMAFLGMVRDTWKDSHDEWRDASSLAQALSFYTPHAMLDAAAGVNIDFDEILRFGRVLYKKLEWKATQAARGSYFDTHAGKKFGYFNCTEKIISEACHELLNRHDCDVAVAFFSKVENGRYDIAVSLRSHKEKVPVNKMAEFHGGGGHQPSAGFRLKDAISVPFGDLVQKVRDAYDSTQAAG